MPQPQQRRAVRLAALVPPALILLGLLAHTVLEGLAIGLQVRTVCSSWLSPATMHYLPIYC